MKTNEVANICSCPCHAPSNQLLINTHLHMILFCSAAFTPRWSGIRKDIKCSNPNKCSDSHRCALFSLQVLEAYFYLLPLDLSRNSTSIFTKTLHAFLELSSLYCISATGATLQIQWNVWNESCFSGLKVDRNWHRYNRHVASHITPKVCYWKPNTPAPHKNK